MNPLKGCDEYVWHDKPPPKDGLPEQFLCETCGEKDHEHMTDGMVDTLRYMDVYPHTPCDRRYRGGRNMWGDARRLVRAGCATCDSTMFTATEYGASVLEAMGYTAKRNARRSM